MKVCVALLVVCVFFSDVFVGGSRRQAKMPTGWRTQVRKSQGHGSFALRGTAGGETSSNHIHTGVVSVPTGADCTQEGFFPTPGSCLKFYRCVSWSSHGSVFSAFPFTCPLGTIFDDDLDICNHPYATRRKDCSIGLQTGPAHLGSTDGSQQGPSGGSQQGPVGGSQQGPIGGSQQGPIGGSQQGPIGGSQQGAVGGSQQGLIDGSQQGPIGGSQQGGPHLVPTSGSQAPAGGSHKEPTDGSQQVPAGGTSAVSQGSTTGSVPEAVTEDSDTQSSISSLPEQSTSASEVFIDLSTEASTQQTSPGVFSLTCYTDSKYRRHPLYCNQYYYCINNGVWSVPIFTCPRDLVFDEENQICARAASELISSCDFAPYSTPRPATTSTEVTSTEAPESDTTITVTDPSTDVTTQKTWELDPNSLYDCPAPGYYPFEGDCVRFYKCVETDLLQLKGLLYRCPTGFGYSEEKQRCLKEKDLPPCQRVPQAAHIRVDTATPLYPEDLVWFFKN